MEQKMKDRYIHAVSVTDASGVAIQHLEYMAFGEVFVDQRRTGFGTPYKFNAKELDCESGYYYYSAHYYDPRMARFLSVDPLAGEMPAWGPYSYTFNNPVRFTDPDGRAPQDKIIETSKGNFKYVKDKYGTNLISTHYLNGDVAYTRKGHGTVMIKSGHAEKKMNEYKAAVAKRRSVIKSIGKGMENTGDVVAGAGYIAAPFTEGASLGLSVIGEGVSATGKVITNAVKLEENGATKENMIDLGLDVLIEIGPTPLEGAVKKSNLEDITKDIIKAEIGKAKQATEFGVKRKIEENRSNDND